MELMRLFFQAGLVGLGLLVLQLARELWQDWRYRRGQVEDAVIVALIAIGGVLLLCAAFVLKP